MIRRSKSESAKRHKSRHISADNTVIRELHSTPVMEVADSPGSGSGAGDVGAVAAAVGTSPRGDVERRASLPSSFAGKGLLVSPCVRVRADLYFISCTGHTFQCQLR